jgi:hypothetical protein
MFGTIAGPSSLPGTSQGDDEQIDTDPNGHGHGRAAE